MKYASIESIIDAPKPHMFIDTGVPAGSFTQVSPSSV